MADCFLIVVVVDRRCSAVEAPNLSCSGDCSAWELVRCSLEGVVMGHGRNVAWGNWSVESTLDSVEKRSRQGRRYSCEGGWHLFEGSRLRVEACRTMRPSALA